MTEPNIPLTYSEYLNNYIAFGRKCANECPPLERVSDIKYVQQWLDENGTNDPLVSIALRSAKQADVNTGWTLIGGKQKVKRVSDMLENSTLHPDLRSFNYWMSGMSNNFYTKFIGGVSQVHYDDLGIASGLSLMDSNKLSLTGKFDKPLKVHRVKEPLSPTDYFRVVDNPYPDSGWYGYGKPALYTMQCVAVVTYAMWEYMQGELSDTAIRGILTISGADSDEVANAHRANLEKIRNGGMDEHDVYRNLLALISDEKIGLEYLKFSRMPDGIGTPRDILDISAMIYAGLLGRPVHSFWQVNSGSFGNSNEAEIMSEASDSTGELAFLNRLAVELNKSIIPSGVKFEFSKLDNEGELERATQHRSYLDNAKCMTDLGYRESDIDDYLVMNQVIKPEYSRTAETSEDEVILNENEARNRRNKSIVKLAKEMRFNNETDPIVEYRWNGVSVERSVLFESPDDAIKPVYQPSICRSIGYETEQRAIEGYQRQYEDELTRLSEQLLNGEIRRSSFIRSVTYLYQAMLLLSFIDGKYLGRVSQATDFENEVMECAKMLFESTRPSNMVECSKQMVAYAEGTIELKDAFNIHAESTESLADEILELSKQIDDFEATESRASASELANLVVRGVKKIGKKIKNRIKTWGRKVVEYQNVGKVVGNPDKLFRWRFGRTIEHCSDCIEQNGQIRTGDEWRRLYQETGIRPRSSALECGGFNCKCTLRLVQGG